MSDDVKPWTVEERDDGSYLFRDSAGQVKFLASPSDPVAKHYLALGRKAERMEMERDHARAGWTTTLTARIHDEGVHSYEGACAKAEALVAYSMRKMHEAMADCQR